VSEREREREGGRERERERETGRERERSQWGTQIRAWRHGV